MKQIIAFQEEGLHQAIPFQYSKKVSLIMIMKYTNKTQEFQILMQYIPVFAEQFH